MKRKLALVLICATAMGACTRGTKKQTTTVDTTSIVNDKSLNPAQKGERLAQASEQLLAPGSFMYAYDVADIALSYDKGNKRAQLIHASLKPAMLLRGIMKRVKPLYDQSATGKAEYDKAIKELAKDPNPGYRNFVLDGKEDLKSEGDVQKLVSALTQAFEEQRQWFKNNKDLEITLTVNGELWQQDRLKEAAKECFTKQIQEGKYEQECDLSGMNQYKINRAEMEMGQQIAAGFEIYSILANSYRLDGSMSYINSVQGKDLTSIPSKTAVESLLRNRSFGTLRDEKGLKSVIALGTDFVAGARWAEKLNDQLCKTGEEDGDNRPGFLAKKGVCVIGKKDYGNGHTGDQLLAMADIILRGGTLSLTIKGEEGQPNYETTVKPAAPFISPVSDVRNLGQLTWDAQGEKVIGTGDKTLGGVFPKGDASEVLQRQDADKDMHE